MALHLLLEEFISAVLVPPLSALAFALCRWVNYDFFPSKEFPILVYFKENQTPPEVMSCDRHVLSVSRMILAMHRRNGTWAQASTTRSAEVR